MKNKPLYRFFDSLDSTSNEARRMLDADFSMGKTAVIVAGKQSQGRGRQGKSFLSPEGGIYFSIILPIGFIEGDYIGITTYAALCASHVISRYSGADARIKWVNDIYVGDRKVCGILTELIRDRKTNQPKAMIIGVGINRTGYEIPSDLAEIAGAVDISREDIEALIGDFYDELTGYGGTIKDYMPEIRRRSCVIGREVCYMAGDTANYGKVTGLSDEGYLEILSAEGASVVLSSGEVSLRFSDDKRHDMLR